MSNDGRWWWCWEPRPPPPAASMSSLVSSAPKPTTTLHSSVSVNWLVCIKINKYNGHIKFDMSAVIFWDHTKCIDSCYSDHVLQNSILETFYVPQQQNSSLWATEHWKDSCVHLIVHQPITEEIYIYSGFSFSWNVNNFVHCKSYVNTNHTSSHAASTQLSFFFFRKLSLFFNHFVTITWPTVWPNWISF